MILHIFLFITNQAGDRFEHCTSYTHKIFSVLASNFISLKSMLRFGLFRSMQMLSSRALSTSLVAPSALLRSFSHSPLPISQTMARMQTLQFPLSQTFHREVQVPLVTNVAEDVSEDNTIYMDSVLRKRRLKMKKHKLRKRRRNQRALKKRLGKL